MLEIMLIVVLALVVAGVGWGAMSLSYLVTSYFIYPCLYIRVKACIDKIEKPPRWGTACTEIAMILALLFIAAQGIQIIKGDDLFNIYGIQALAAFLCMLPLSAIRDGIHDKYGNSLFIGLTKPMRDKRNYLFDKLGDFSEAVLSIPIFYGVLGLLGFLLPLASRFMSVSVIGFYSFVVLLPISIATWCYVDLTYPKESDHFLRVTSARQRSIRRIVVQALSLFFALITGYEALLEILAERPVSVTSKSILLFIGLLIAADTFLDAVVSDHKDWADAANK